MTHSPRAPLLSVIVPTFERPLSLDRCLHAIAAQQFPRDQFEVVVVDDGISVPPREVVARLASGAADSVR